MNKVNYLLVMPRLVQNVNDGYSFPLGIVYVSASMKKAGFNIFTLNLNHHEGDIFNILKNEIVKNRIDVVATGGLSFQFATVKEVVESAKKINKKIITVVGGGIITSDAKPAMEALEFADYGVIGEGEITLKEFGYALENKGDLSKVNGLIYKIDENKYIKTEARAEILDINLIPWPDYDGFELDKYLAVSPSVSGINRKNTVFMIASRSCPFNCTFCFHTVGQKYRQRNLDNFFEELDYMVKKYKIDFITLADELFSSDPDRVKEFCRRILKYKLDWWAQFRVDHIVKNPELLKMVKEAGCSVMSYGLESADNRVLKSMRKNITVEQIEKAMKLTYEAGISAEGAFIFGDIEETWETAKNTLKWWKEHFEYKINLNLITVYPGTYLYQYACEKGIIKDKVKFLKDGCPQVNVSKLNGKQISKIVKEIVEEPMMSAKKLRKQKIDVVDSKTGRVDIFGECINCDTKNSWKGVRLFSSSFLACKKCGQRYNMILSKEIRIIIDNNILFLLKKFKKIGIWGVNYHTIDLLNKSKLSFKKIFIIDISNIKQNLYLKGKKVNPPQILEKEKIKFVIIPIPAYINQITEQIRTDHKNVSHVIDACELIDKNFKNKYI